MNTINFTNSPLHSWILFWHQVWPLQILEQNNTCKYHYFIVVLLPERIHEIQIVWKYLYSKYITPNKNKKYEGQWEFMKEGNND